MYATKFILYREFIYYQKTMKESEMNSAHVTEERDHLYKIITTDMSARSLKKTKRKNVNTSLKPDVDIID